METKTKFQYSQASLQDFSACNRRFYYRYHEKLKWPAVESSPVLANENYMAMGAAFHLLVHQYVLGIDKEVLAISAENSGLGDWWQNFLQYQPFDNSAELITEKKFVATVGEHRVLAKFDLVVKTSDGKLIIFDWKTSRKLPTRAQMEGKWQSKVYPFVLAKMGKYFGIDENIDPENIELQYWYTQFPKSPEIFSYSAEKFKKHESEIEVLIDEIEGLEGKSEFLLTDNQRLCNYCVYRSLCERGTQAGLEIDRVDLLDDTEEDWDIDFEQVGEIAY